jgi:hypothetical protein
VDNNHTRVARAFGEFTVPAVGASAVYRAIPWTRIAKLREFSNLRAHPDQGPVELGSASMNGTEVGFPTKLDSEQV